jgi:ABC-type microcin C transport system permease subunit YejE
MTNSSHGNRGSRRRRGAWSLWLLLILVPLAVWVPLYNRIEPTFIGFPFFYWFLLLEIIIGAVLTALAYLVSDGE